MMSNIETGIGLDIVEWFNTGPGFLWYILSPLAAIGSEIGIMVLLATVYWSISVRHGRRLLLIVLGSQIVSNIFKIAFARPRPFHVAPGRIEALGESGEFGIPSGHTIFGSVSGLWLIDTLRRRWVTILAVVYTVAMGLSRMVHGVHFPQDVLLGWILGFVYYGMYVAIERRVTRPLWSAPSAVALGTIAAGTVVLFFVALALNGEFEARKGVLSVVGALSGALVGLVVDTRRIRFSTAGSLSRRLLRPAVGLPLLAAVYFGAAELYHLIVGDTESAGALVLYVLRYAVVGFAATALIPAVLCRLGLAAGRQTVAGETG